MGYLALARPERTEIPFGNVRPSGYGHGVADQEILIRARGLRKQFGDFVAVDGIDFELSRGEVFGFLGPNGAGKS